MSKETIIANVPCQWCNGRQQVELDLGIDEWVPNIVHCDYCCEASVHATFKRTDDDTTDLRSMKFDGGVQEPLLTNDERLANLKHHYGTLKYEAVVWVYPHLDDPTFLDELADVLEYSHLYEDAFTFEKVYDTLLEDGFISEVDPLTLVGKDRKVLAMLEVLAVQGGFNCYGFLHVSHDVIDTPNRLSFELVKSYLDSDERKLLALSEAMQIEDLNDNELKAMMDMSTLLNINIRHFEYSNITDELRKLNRHHLQDIPSDLYYNYFDRDKWGYDYNDLHNYGCLSQYGYIDIPKKQASEIVDVFKFYE